MGETLIVYQVGPDHMNKPLDWRDRMHLAACDLTNDLGHLDVTEATEALEYIEALETAILAERMK